MGGKIAECLAMGAAVPGAICRHGAAAGACAVAKTLNGLLRRHIE
jgi:hypothetical protein